MQVRLDRLDSRVESRPPIGRPIQGDASNSEDVAKLIAGADVVVSCVGNPNRSLHIVGATLFELRRLRVHSGGEAVCGVVDVEQAVGCDQPRTRGARPVAGGGRNQARPERGGTRPLPATLRLFMMNSECW